MSDKLLDIDLAMNMIKEDITKELYESVSKQNNLLSNDDVTSSSFYFSEKRKD